MGRPLSGKALACLRSSKSFVIKLSRFSQSSGICFISRILAYVCMLNLRSTDTKIWKRATLWNRIENTHPEIYKPENEVFFTNAGMENGSFVSSFHSCSPTSPRSCPFFCHSKLNLTSLNSLQVTQGIGGGGDRVDDGDCPVNKGGCSWMYQYKLRFKE